jgi:hypothetical protein
LFVLPAYLLLVPFLFVLPYALARPQSPTLFIWLGLIIPNILMEIYVMYLFSQPLFTIL